MNGLASWLANPGLPSAAVIGTVLIPLAAAIAIVVINRAIRRLLDNANHRLHLTPKAANAIPLVTGLVLWLCAMLLVINVWGVSVGGVVHEPAARGSRASAEAA